MPLRSTTKSRRTYPALPGVGDSVPSHTSFLRQAKENIEIHERRTDDILSSFISVRDLVDLGIVKIRGDQIVLGQAFD